MTVITAAADVAAYAINLAGFGIGAAALARIAFVECDDKRMEFFDTEGQHVATYCDCGRASWACVCGEVA
ncbi:MAG TPA: hypothetical protein VGF33_05615 [Caulobacteraceae bacterium]|jgi:hypothetical protein